MLALALCLALPAADPWLHLPGTGPKVVLISGDEEYRSEEALPQLAKILNTHHGFDCTVLFAIDPADGTINPNVTDNLPGLEKVATADLVVIALRFRGPPDDKLKHLIDYAEAGKPLVALRTSTHALKLKKDSAPGSVVEKSFVETCPIRASEIPLVVVVVPVVPVPVVVPVKIGLRGVNAIGILSPALPAARMLAARSRVCELFASITTTSTTTSDFGLSRS